MENENFSPAAPAASAPATNEQPSTSAPSDTSQGTAPQDPAGSQTPEQKPRARGAQQRIEQLVWQRQEAERRAIEAESRLAAAQREREVAQTRQQLEADEPNPDKFADLRSYMAAHSAWTQRKAEFSANERWEQRMAESTARQAQAYAEQVRFQQHQEMESRELNSRFEEGVKKYPDFLDKIQNPELPNIRGTHAFNAVMRLRPDKFVEVSYALANNPAELERIGAIADPYMAMHEVASLAARLSGPAATSAPPPPPSRNGASASGPRDWNGMSTREHAQAYWGRHKRK